MSREGVYFSPRGSALSHGGDPVGADAIEARVLSGEKVCQGAPDPVAVECEVEPKSPCHIKFAGPPRDGSLKFADGTGELDEEAPLWVGGASRFAVVGVLLAVEPAYLAQLAGLEVPPLRVVCIAASRRVGEIQTERPEQVLALDELPNECGCAVLIFV